MAAGFTSLRSDGILVAFVIDGIGVEVQVVGSPGQMSTLSGVITGVPGSHPRLPSPRGVQHLRKRRAR